PPSFAPYTVEFLPVRVEEARVTPVLSPDTSHLILEMLERAESHIAIEQAYIRNASATELNPFLNAAIDASRRGVAVRVLLDSSWFNVEGDADNDEMVALINRIARQENLPLEARCADLAANNLEKIHTKGVIVDGREVLVSSINWNENSPNFNREAGVIIEHPEIGAYFMAAFLDDWDASRAGAGADDRDYRKIAVGGVVLAALMVVYLRRHR
ncbi:MAG: phospholipase D-like domain-containing protein, partial [Methanomicrobiaceae archaeon]|nr:phospholipase D-like domain-containing protein [Methanomicrobiaceae archaeon]